MTVDIERGLQSVVNLGRAGIGASLVGLGGYVVFGSFAAIGTTHWPYPLLAIRADPVLNALFVTIGLSAAVMSAALAFLAGVSAANPAERSVIVLAGALGVGFGTSLVRICLPVVVQYVMD